MDFAPQRDCAVEILDQYSREMGILKVEEKERSLETLPSLF